MRKERFMDYGCNVRKVRRIIKIRGFQNKITHVKSFFECGTNKKFNILHTGNYLLIFTLLFFCFVTSGNAIDVTLKWTPNNESNLAGYTVFYRQEGQPYNYTTPYWETTDPACTIYDLDETQTYYFTVRAFSTEGFQSGNSNEVCLEAGTTTGN
ncbi:MAG: fibronectin type III domain-containing protein [Desulfobacterales bacterium]